MVMMRWFLGLYGGKGICQNVSTPTLKSVFERGNKKCEIEGTNISSLGIDV
jgi:hypothetical protein